MKNSLAYFSFMAGLILIVLGYLNTQQTFCYSVPLGGLPPGCITFTNFSGFGFAMIIAGIVPIIYGFLLLTMFRVSRRHGRGNSG